ncbi:ClpP/crotonase-like domain protein [Raphanus sativus]|nr:ClpP/crotonase-like domain protein [Raphanus sativus]
MGGSCSCSDGELLEQIRTVSRQKGELQQQIRTDTIFSSRERDHSDAERSQNIHKLSELQEHFQEKERQYAELQEQLPPRSVSCSQCRDVAISSPAEWSLTEDERLLRCDGWDPFCFGEVVVKDGSVGLVLGWINAANKAREVSSTSLPLAAGVVEKLGLANQLVEQREAWKKPKKIAENIIKNEQGMLLRIKSVINDELKLDLGHALALEKVKTFRQF